MQAIRRYRKSRWWPIRLVGNSLMTTSDQGQRCGELDWQDLVVALRCTNDVYFDIVAPYQHLLSAVNQPHAVPLNLAKDTVYPRTWCRPGFKVLRSIP